MSRSSLPPLSCLQAFEAAARHCNFTQAGAELSLTQSAISRQIKRLEDDLGRPLFERRADGLALTPTGEHFFRVVQRLLRELANETTHLRARGDDDRLTIASSPTIASIWLARQLPEFQALFPDIAIRILTVEDPHRLDLSEFDLGIYYHVPGEVEPPGLGCEPIFADEDVVAVCAPSYLDQNGKPDSAGDLLRNHTLMVVEDHYHDWLTWQGWFEALGFNWQPPERTLRANSYQLLMNGALAGQGVTLGWAKLLREDLEQRNLVQVLPDRLPSRGSLSLFTPTHRHMTDAMRHFRNWLVDPSRLTGSGL